MEHGVGGIEVASLRADLKAVHHRHYGAVFDGNVSGRSHRKFAHFSRHKSKYFRLET